MRRALPLATVAACALASPRSARAGDLRVRAEVAAEVDSNVNHAERPVRHDDDSVVPRGAALVRAGARLDASGGLAGGRWGTQLGVDGRAQAEGDATDENVAVLSAQARWARPLRGRPVRTGARVAAYDAAGHGDVGARTFRWLLAEGLLGLDDGERHALLSAGYHDFVYQPDARLDWRGPSLGLDLGAQLWRDPGAASSSSSSEISDGADASSLELSARYRLEDRGYQGLALASGCPPGSEGACAGPTGERRADLVHRLAAGVTYTGDRVYAAEYELTVVDSTSLGQSLVRHRVVAAATLELPAGLLASARLALQLDQYLDGLLVPVAGDVQSLTSIDEENRSSLSLHLARPLGGGVTVEGRWAYWTSLGASGADFSRHLVSVGLVWASGS